MTYGALLVARLSSTRLPAKNLMELAGKPMIQHLAERVVAAPSVDKVIIATSTEPSDDPLADFAASAGILCHRGPLDDLMARICGAARAHGCDTILEILGDNPLVEAGVIEAVMELFRSNGLDYAANISRDYGQRSEGLALFPLGVRVQVYSRTAERYKEFPDFVNDPDRHPTCFIFDQPDRFKLGFLEARGVWTKYNRPALNFAVNYKKNFDLARSIFERHYPRNPQFSLADVLEQLDEEPHLYALFGAE